jgi:hypothetical protein
MTIISKQGGNDHDNLVGWRRTLKSRVEIIVIKESGKGHRIKLSGWTNYIHSFLQHHGQNW